MSDLVGNPEDRFSHNEAHIVKTPLNHTFIHENLIFFNSFSGKNGTRIAFITFASKANITFNLKDENVRTVEKAFQKIDSVTVSWTLSFAISCNYSTLTHLR